MWKGRSNSIPAAVHGRRLCLMKLPLKTPSPSRDGKDFLITAAVLSRQFQEQNGRNARPTSSALLVNPTFGRLFTGGGRLDQHPDSLQKPALPSRTQHIKRGYCGVSLSPTSRRWPPLSVISLSPVFVRFPCSELSPKRLDFLACRLSVLWSAMRPSLNSRACVPRSNTPLLNASSRSV